LLGHIDIFDAGRSAESGENGVRELVPSVSLARTDMKIPLAERFAAR